MSKTLTPDFVAILRLLREHRVDFLVVGGVGAVLQGTPVTTFDLDVVHARDPENVERLGRALEALEPVQRAQPEKKLRPEASDLSSTGRQLLMTKFGPLDLLGMIGRNRGYADLLPHRVMMKIEEGLHVAVLDLDTLIQTKQETGGEKDRAMLAVLRRTLEEKRHRKP